MGKLPQKQGGRQQHRLRLHKSAPRGRSPAHNGRHSPHHGPHPRIDLRPRLELRVNSRIEDDVAHAQRGRDGVRSRQKHEAARRPREESPRFRRGGRDSAHRQGSMARPFHGGVAIYFEYLVESGGGGAAEGRASRGRCQGCQAGGGGEGCGAGGQEAQRRRADYEERQAGFGQREEAGEAAR